MSNLFMSEEVRNTFSGLAVSRHFCSYVFWVLAITCTGYLGWSPGKVIINVGTVKFWTCYIISYGLQVRTYEIWVPLPYIVSK